MILEQTDLFLKDLRNLSRKYPSLDEDLKRFGIALRTDGEKLSGLVRIPAGSSRNHLLFYKAKKFRCTFLPGGGSRSGIRVIIFFKRDVTPKVVFLEIYHKEKDSTDCDTTRIINFDETKSYAPLFLD